MKLNNWIIKPLLALAVAMPLVSTVQVQSADAHHRYKRAAIIAGAIVGGVIAHRHYRKHRKHRHYGYGHRKHRHYGYGHRYRGSGHRSIGGPYYHPKLGRTIGIR